MGFLSLCVLHAVGYIFVAASSGYSNSPLSKRPHLAAHFLPQLLGFIALAYLGGGSWLMEMPSAELAIGDYLYVGERVSCIMIAFQMYEIAATILAPRLRGAAYEMVVHHCITLLLSALAYKYQAYHYWAPCFMGLSEISSIPLAFLDFFKQVLASRLLLSVRALPVPVPAPVHVLGAIPTLTLCRCKEEAPIDTAVSVGVATTRSSRKSVLGCQRQTI